MYIMLRGISCHDPESKATTKYIQKINNLEFSNTVKNSISFSVVRCSRVLS